MFKNTTSETLRRAGVHDVVVSWVTSESERRESERRESERRESERKRVLASEQVVESCENEVEVVDLYCSGGQSLLVVLNSTFNYLLA